MATVRHYYPEMGDARPECDVEARQGRDGKWIVVSPTELPKGRGVTLVCQYRPQDLVKQAQHKVGWFEYRLTDRAFDRLDLTASLEMCL
jgi:hypothetical protein